MGLTPSSAARERIVSALTPAASATAMAACSTRSRLSGTRLLEPSLVGFNFAFPDDSTPILCMVTSCTKYGGQHGPSDRKKQLMTAQAQSAAVVGDSKRSATAVSAMQAVMQDRYGSADVLRLAIGRASCRERV